jgi:hypothetical protein
MSISYGDERPIRFTQATNTATRRHEMTLNFPYFMSFKDEEVALNQAFIYYSWFNITAAYGNNTVSYLWQDDAKTNTEYSITLPDGFYTYDDISSCIQLKMYDNGHYLVDKNGNYVYYISLSANITIYGTTVTCTPVPASLPTDYTNPKSIYLSGVTPQLKISNSLFGNVLGFATGTFPAAQQATIYQVNNTKLPVLTQVNVVNITCNIVNNPGINQDTNTLYTFSPSEEYPNLLREDPSNLLYYRCFNGNFDSITLGFYDENFKPIQIMDPNITVLLRVRKRHVNYKQV